MEEAVEGRMVKETWKVGLEDVMWKKWNRMKGLGGGRILWRGVVDRWSVCV